MRLMITLPDDVVAWLFELAHRHHRYPKQEVEWLLAEVLRAGRDTGADIVEDGEAKAGIVFHPTDWTKGRLTPAEVVDGD